MRNLRLRAIAVDSLKYTLDSSKASWEVYCLLFCATCFYGDALIGHSGIIDFIVGHGQYKYSPWMLMYFFFFLLVWSQSILVTWRRQILRKAWSFQVIVTYITARSGVEQFRLDVSVEVFTRSYPNLLQNRKVKSAFPTLILRLIFSAMLLSAETTLQTYTTLSTPSMRCPVSQQG